MAFGAPWSPVPRRRASAAGPGGPEAHVRLATPQVPGLSNGLLRSYGSVTGPEGFTPEFSDGEGCR